MAAEKRRDRTGGIDPHLAKVREHSDECSRVLSGLPFRDQIKRIAGLFQSVRDLGVATAVAHGYDPRSGLERILQYLKEHVGQVIAGAEIEVVSGISEYGRRVRELRVQHGYNILTGASPDPESGVDLRPDEYLLTDLAPNEGFAERWGAANSIRRNKTLGSREKILQFLKVNVGQVVTTEQLSYVSDDKKEFGRRTRELRTQDGFPIATRFTGRPDLKNGEYILLSLDRIAEPHDRHIPHEVQKAVYGRDENTCRLCGWKTASWSPADPRILELHHVQEHHKGGANTTANLVTICSKCHDGIHAGRVTIPDALIQAIRGS